MPLKPGTLRRLYFPLAVGATIALCAVLLIAGPLYAPYSGGRPLWVIAIPATLATLIVLGLTWVAWRWRPGGPRAIPNEDRDRP